jgi:hydrogenase maturation protease
MERLVGAERAIIVDAIQTGKSPEGSVQVFALEELENPFLGHIGSAHETHLQSAMILGRKMDVHLPENVMIVGIETNPVVDFSDTLSTRVSAAVPAAAQIVLDLIQSIRPWEG